MCCQYEKFSGFIYTIESKFKSANLLSSVNILLVVYILYFVILQPDWLRGSLYTDVQTGLWTVQHSCTVNNALPQ